MKQLKTVLLIILAACVQSSFAAEVVINFDFGNGTTYVGDDGILSSPSGTFWNRIEVDPNLGLKTPDFGPLRDEFGRALAEQGVFADGSPIATTGTGPGPVSDGVNFAEFDFGLIVFRRFTAPVDVVVYFVEPGVGNTIGFGEGAGFDIHVASTTEVTPAPLFPGEHGVHYLEYEDLDIRPTTIGIQTLPGVSIHSIDHRGIGAIQIRGTVVPEPSSTVVLFAITLFTFARQRNGRSKTAVRY